MPDMVAAGFKERSLHDGVSAGWSTLPFVKEGGKLYFYYDGLGDRYKEAIVKKFGNPYEYMAKEPIRRMVTKDYKAEAFFLEYRYAGPTGNDSLPFETIKKYTWEASWLNMLNACDADKKNLIKRTLNLSIDKFYENVIALLRIEISNGSIGAKFPTSYQRLLGKMKQYKEESYASLIHPSFGNKAAAKIVDEATDVLKKLLEDPLQHDDVMVAYLYNKWAAANGYKDIKAGIVGLRRKEWMPELIAGREGWNAFTQKYVRQVKGLPSNTMHPLALVESDDYNLNYYYQDEKGKHRRYVSYIVADSATGLILGGCYRAADAPVFQMIQIAYLDAMYYIRSLVGDGNWYLPFEVKADHWNFKNVEPYLKGIAQMIPPAVGNKSGRGYIEQLFGSHHFKRAEKVAATNELNYNGNNITAKSIGVNIEVLKANAKSRPMIGAGAEAQIDRFIWTCRNMPAFTRENMDAPSKEQQFLEKWQSLPAEQKRTVDDLQFLLIFGIKHAPQGRGITITNRGVEPQINGIKYSYDLPNYVDDMSLIGKEVFVHYDPYDMSRVLVTDGDRIRFICKHAVLQPRALAYQYGGSREALNMILEEKKAQVNHVAQLANGRAERPVFDVKAALFGGMMPKELMSVASNQAEEARLIQRTATQQFTDEYEQFLDDNNDFSQFFNS